jgi:3-dehydro-L-gulonate 2-dehydrogenase
MQRIDFDELRGRIERVLLGLGVPPERAVLGARLTAETDRDGVRTHGIARLPRFAEMVRLGRIDPRATPSLVLASGAIERWTGHRGPGNLAAHAAMQRAIELAKSHGIGLVGLAETSHWMRAGSYGWQAAEAGFAALCWTNTLPNLPPWGATSPALGNNPLVIAIPRRDDEGASAPIVLDIAMSQFSYGTLAQYRAQNKPLPVPGGYDAASAITTDAAAIEQSQRALPIGFWKGSPSRSMSSPRCSPAARPRTRLAPTPMPRSASRRSSSPSHPSRSLRWMSSAASPRALSTPCMRLRLSSPVNLRAILGKAR